MLWRKGKRNTTKAQRIHSMGTNYYAHNKKTTCECCGRADDMDILHIGKSSIGWTFSFQGFDEKYHQPKIKSLKDWKIFLSDPDIFIQNEYGDKISNNDFFEVVNSKQNDDNQNHAKLYPEGNWVDEDGYSFTGGIFS